MKIILDTNVFISGIFWSGPPYQILNAWKARQISLAVSQEILNEYDRVSKALSNKYTGIDLSVFMELLANNSELYVAKKLNDQISRDPDDDKFIAVALAGGAEFIVSGDQALLDVGTYQGVQIMNPSNFLKSL